MTNNLALLEIQIQRLFLKDAEKKRLLDELKKVDQEKLALLTALIKEQDEESLKILDEKNRAMIEVKTRLQGDRNIETSEDELKENITRMGEILSDEGRFAKFMSLADDLILVQLEQVLFSASEGNKNAQSDIKSFFQEIRLLKTSLEKKNEKKMKEFLLKQKQERTDQIKRLEDAVSTAMKAIKESEKRAGK